MTYTKNQSGYFLIALCLTSSLLGQYIPSFPDEPSSQPSQKKHVSLEDRVTRLEAQNLNLYPTSDRVVNAYSYGALLYWKPYVPNFVFASSVNVMPTLPNGVGMLNNHIKFNLVSFEFNPGFRVGAGKIFMFDYWSLNLEWNHLHATGKTSTVSATTDTTIFEVWSQPDAKTSVQSITAIPKVTYDLLELDLIRSMWFSKNFALGLIFGLEGVALGTTFKITTWAQPGDNANHFVHMGNNFLGGGSSIGMDANFYLGKGFSLFGFGKTALYVGCITTKSADLYTVQSNNTELGRTFQKNYTPTVQSGYQSNMGLEWKRDFYKDKLNLALFAAFEMTFFQTQVKLRQFINSPSTSFLLNQIGDIDFQGLVFGAKLTF